jgi:hypothetical protein
MLICPLYMLYVLEHSRESLRDTNPQSITFVPANRGRVDIDYLKEKLKQMCITDDR